MRGGVMKNLYRIVYNCSNKDVYCWYFKITGCHGLRREPIFYNVFLCFKWPNRDSIRDESKVLHVLFIPRGWEVGGVFWVWFELYLFRIPNRYPKLLLSWEWSKKKYERDRSSELCENGSDSDSDNDSDSNSNSDRDCNCNSNSDSDCNSDSNSDSDSDSDSNCNSNSDSDCNSDSDSNSNCNSDSDNNSDSDSDNDSDNDNDSDSDSGSDSDSDNDNDSGED